MQKVISFLMMMVLAMPAFAKYPDSRATKPSEYTIDPREYLQGWGQGNCTAPYNKILKMHMIGTCTAEYVAPNILLTALHCVESGVDPVYEGKQVKFINCNGKDVLATVQTFGDLQKYRDTADDNIDKLAFEKNGEVDWVLLTVNESQYFSKDFFNVDDESKKPTEIVDGTPGYYVDIAGFGGMQILSDSEISKIKEQVTPTAKEYLKQQVSEDYQENKELLELAINRVWEKVVDTTGITGDNDNIKTQVRCGMLPRYHEGLNHGSDCYTWGGYSGGPYYTSDNIIRGIVHGGVNSIPGYARLQFVVPTKDTYVSLQELKKQFDLTSCPDGGQRGVTSCDEDEDVYFTCRTYDKNGNGCLCGECLPNKNEHSAKCLSVPRAAWSEEYKTCLCHDSLGMPDFSASISTTSMDSCKYNFRSGYTTGFECVTYAADKKTCLCGKCTYTKNEDSSPVPPEVPKTETPEPSESTALEQQAESAPFNMMQMGKIITNKGVPTGVQGPTDSAPMKQLRSDISKYCLEKIDKLSDKEFFEWCLGPISEYQRLRQEYEDALKREKALSNRVLSGLTMAATGIGGMMLAQGLAEKKADEAAEQDMRAYLQTFRCEYGDGHSFQGGQSNIELPGGNALTTLYQEFKSLAADLKERKTALGLKPGLESKEFADKASSGLYDDVSTGKTSGAFTSISRALQGSEADATAWAEQKEKSQNKTKLGGAIGGVGAVGGAIGNLGINGADGKKLTTPKTDKKNK